MDDLIVRMLMVYGMLSTAALTARCSVTSDTAQNINLKAGSMVSLVCRTNSTRRIRWSFIGDLSVIPVSIFNGETVNINFLPRSAVTYNAARGESRLEIRATSPSDSGLYECHESMKAKHNIVFNVTVSDVAEWQQHTETVAVRSAADPTASPGQSSVQPSADDDHSLTTTKAGPQENQPSKMQTDAIIRGYVSEAAAKPEIAASHGSKFDIPNGIMCVAIVAVICATVIIIACVVVKQIRATVALNESDGRLPVALQSFPTPRDSSSSSRPPLPSSFLRLVISDEPPHIYHRPDNGSSPVQSVADASNTGQSSDDHKYVNVDSTHSPELPYDALDPATLAERESQPPAVYAGLGE